MKLVYCLLGTFNSGGMERIVIKKANWFASQGHDVTIVTTEQQGRPHFFPVDERIRCVDLDVNYRDNQNQHHILKKYWIRRQKLQLHRRRLAELLYRERPDITVSTYGNEIDFLYKIKDGSKKVTEIHFSRWFRLQCEQPGILYRQVNRYLTWRDRRLAGKYDAFVCLTEEDRGSWGTLSNIHVIPNFVENRGSEPARLTGCRAIAVGRLDYQKGYDRLIDAWARVHAVHPEWKLDIFGNGELKQPLVEQIATYKLGDAVRICPPTKEIDAEYRNSSFLVLSSRYEGLPMVMLEAMNAGLPVVAFACKCGPRDLIDDGENGLLIPEGDTKKFAEGILKLIENADLRQSFGQRAFVSSLRYGEDTVMKQWMTLFDTLISS